MLEMENWADVFEYRNGKLFWSISPSRGVKSGSQAGCKHPYGYMHVRYKGRNYKVHRAIWEMHYGAIPDGMTIDHINHVRDDNRIDNLRVVSMHENNKNASKRNDNTTGVTGVYWRKDRSEWQAKIYTDGKQVHIGYFNDFQSAVNARLSAEKKFGFHQNHGNPKG
ncbi:HNH endonuclease [Salmonella enterica subsp. enterica serovar Reading]|nr:HNH endonuclease [Salmonella enterica subsp. enterica serovar Reading]MCP0078130.1 HNH endonuclease [Salmonella enterica subsp. enterica serovar Reading]MCP0094691.1 HNH endonuclease [Salmonella enterica subsp. enterica serovar Reading]MCP0424814.1 HNH endonuclease [Salmonella enterica subsp. enterica serovar Reading]MCR3079947.1 HNH endonuclease [Salmonella enterica subsp. enterica serovar Reading]